MAFPCLWSLVLAWPSRAQGVGFWELAAFFSVFTTGAFVLRSAGCIWNDILDRRIDAQVQRTRGRPLACGEIGIAQALCMLFALLLVGFGLLFLLPFWSAVLAALSLPLVALYPTAKRWSSMPQVMLGLTFNWGALVGWTSMTGTLDGTAFLLYAGCFFWTLGYDTLYACQDRGDDIRLGIGSLARFEEVANVWGIGAFYVVALGFLAAAGWLGGDGWLFWPTFAIACMLLVQQLRGFRLEDVADIGRRFRFSSWFGWTMLVAFAMRAELPN